MTSSRIGGASVPARTGGAPGSSRRPLLRAAGFVVAGLPLSLLGTAYVLLILYIGGLLSLTLIGLPLLALGLQGARRLTRVHLRLLRALLGEEVESPAPPGAEGVIAWVRGSLSDITAWRSVLYLLLRLPLDLLGFVAALGLPLFGVWSAVWALASGQPWWFALTTVLVAPATLALAPVAVRALARLHRSLARALLGPTASQLRVRTLEWARGAALAESDRGLRQVERDLHDGTQAQLVALAMTLSLTADALADGAREATGDAPADGVREATGDAPADGIRGTAGAALFDRPRTLVARARAQTDDAIAELRRLIDGISPAALDRGLLDALPQLTGRAGVPTTLTVDLPQQPDPAIERVAYFCVAELLTNVAKHSGADRASVDVRLASKRLGGKKLRITVHDNGIGGAGFGKGSGLSGLRERLAAVDGTVSLDSPGTGTTSVVLEMPLHI
ncbi:sensor histidine kinase [Streptomyces sp. NPDC004111]|uniref:sensor histidine kinase n=1 Tax=Streptomyces sp. NPDC004111 TaxID=3364690 RepID=UPI00368DFC24